MAPLRGPRAISAAVSEQTNFDFIAFLLRDWARSMQAQMSCVRRGLVSRLGRRSAMPPDDDQIWRRIGKKSTLSEQFPLSYSGLLSGERSKLCYHGMRRGQTVAHSME